MRTLRRDALAKLATLAASSPPSAGKQADIARLCKRCPGTRSRLNGSTNGRVSRASNGTAAVARVPMSLPEIEALLALCKAAPIVTNIEIAAQLLPQLTSYLPEAHFQVLLPPLSSPDLEPSPWEPLTYNLVTAVLSLGLNHTSLRQHAFASVNRYVGTWADAAGSLSQAQLEEEDGGEPSIEQIARIVKMAVSLAGFLSAAAKFARFWTPMERFKLIRVLREALSEKYMIALEASLSIVRNSRHSEALAPWRHYSKRYAVSGRPLGAMILRQGFMELVVACTSLLVVPYTQLGDRDILEVLLSDEKLPTSIIGPEVPLEGLTEIASDELGLLEEGADYLKMGSAWQQRLASAVKANALTCFLCCSILDEDIADSDALVSWLEGIITDPVQIADEYLASVVFKSMAVLAKTSPSISSNMARVLPRIIVQGGLATRTASIAAECLASVLKRLPQDTVITTLYSLGNVLSAKGAGPDRGMTASPFNEKTKQNGEVYIDPHSDTSVISLGPAEGEEPSLVHITTIEAIVCIAWNSRDEIIIALALSMLIQKIGRLSLEVDAKIVTETAILGVHSAPSELKALLRLYSKVCHDGLIHDNDIILDAVMRARLHLAHGIKREDSDRFEVYLLFLLDSVVSQGDAHEKENKEHSADVELAAQEIGQLLKPLAALTLANAAPGVQEDVEIDGFVGLQRDAWYNAVVHGFTATSPLGKRHRQELQVLAQHSLPLITDERTDQLESDIELNTTLRRGKNDTNLAKYRKHLAEVIPSCEADIKNLSYSEAIFLTTAYLVETLRASSGDCSRMLTYFLDPRLKSGAMGNCMNAIAKAAVNIYLAKSIAGDTQTFTTPYVAQQLALFFAGCCHRISDVQRIAVTCADLIISSVPSALCQKSSLFALFELLTLMWTGCLEQETDEYEWQSTYHSSQGNVTIELSDDYYFRRMTMGNLAKWARIWMLKVLDIAPLDIKGLIQTYLSEFNDDGAYGHVSLGRSFALEMGGVIPSTDQRLGAIEIQSGLNINTASDFIAQYTTRQEYRFVGGIRDDDQEWMRFGAEADPLLRQRSRLDKSIEDANALLVDMEARTMHHKHVSIGELRDVLRRAGALLCRTRKDQGAIVHHLVGIPFAVFTKQSIKLGISLWMGVIKENARMESRIFVEIAENWENTVRTRRGLFSPMLEHYDPFYIKQEFAPSDKELIVKRHRAAYDMIAPHLRVAQFLSSHFNATRLGSPYIQRIYYRLITITLDALRESHCHPLAREAHFHIVLLGLRILRFSTGLSAHVMWRFKDRLLSAALSWFASPPRWSFGGNRLQVKAETHLLEDIRLALEKVQNVGLETVGSRKSLQPKVDLLQLLLGKEHIRLTVWLFPLDHEKKHRFTSGHNAKPPTEAALSIALKTAWAENPAIAIQFAKRFDTASLTAECRFILLNFPEKALDQSDALELLLGPALPADVSFQLKYLLYWAPVNPITAVNYFLPAYDNNPFVIQYATRALDSHPVDVVFFYVPQIVQTLRYDVLGYVERYIIETAKFSQLFAHQIIWNMNANAFKDEDSTIPDPVKPTLDKVTASLISSFSKEDEAFYQREFSFFNEVTDISGKLKPYIKKSKPEKKQKIEEELRKIKVEIGVYLPSNPDGVVVGIDRKSGKPLQSHAKAPYMATFRIKKERVFENADENENQLMKAAGKGAEKKQTFEVWQSAIFKVGDDCRQDVLALQLIAAFRGIFHNVGLDVYVFPYRVTATAPGCGVIDVLPNSISRDMLGREAVNGLYDYFVSKYGSEDSIRFQEARNAFVKSMAAYSVISYLLQFKDRHNGNIMIDDAGHILHIDFGFCFDIVPGGVKFEQAPFKLTPEMVAVMGGPNAQAYQWFEELCIKAFLASREHSGHLEQMVGAMLDSGLPCFKPLTMKNLEGRFMKERSEREAADGMRALIKKSYGSWSTKGYDQFQLLTNGIPY
ncbi:phosphatidylinositol 4-kinase-like protein STT4 [Venturia nashicola]|uniref:1-phosphatidylinositol 4-kinase n=1 Tax=Venturia nashicola TaxID=86259 RepID=A0A4Z1PDU2_9PEZI|nr:phosphatidylinositol 4-kinase-like protein STT4 [Venturia nashicola]